MYNPLTRINKSKHNQIGKSNKRFTDKISTAHDAHGFCQLYEC